MYIEYNYVDIKCNKCGKVYSDLNEYEDYNEIDDDAEYDGWLIEDGKHYCPDCYAEMDECESKSEPDDIYTQMRKSSYNNTPSLFDSID